MLIRSGYIVFSPLTMTHPIDVELAGSAGSLGSDFWVKFDEAFMPFCAEIVVLRVDGWDRSSGVFREIEYFKKQGKPIRYLDLEELPAPSRTTKSTSRHLVQKPSIRQRARRS